MIKFLKKAWEIYFVVSFLVFLLMIADLINVATKTGQPPPYEYLMKSIFIMPCVLYLFIKVYKLKYIEKQDSQFPNKPEKHKTTKDNKDIALHLLNFSEKYLALVKNVLRESIKNKNQWRVSGETGTINYHDVTKWSDFNIIMPILFNFYHGLELLMKGILIAGDKNIKMNHSLSDLLKKIKSIATVDKEFANIIERHIDTSLISNRQFSNFLNVNNLSTDKLYEVFRYPTNKNFDVIYKYFSLKYQGDKWLPYFEEIISDINDLLRIAVKLYANKHAD